MLFVTNLTWNSFTSQKVKCMLYLGEVLSLYVLIYNLKVSFNFHSTFLQLNVIKMLTVQWKLFFSLLPAIFFELPITQTPDNSNFFRFPLKVRVIESQLYALSACANKIFQNWMFSCLLKVDHVITVMQRAYSTSTVVTRLNVSHFLMQPPHKVANHSL